MKAETKTIMREQVTRTIEVQIPKALLFHWIKECGAVTTAEVDLGTLTTSVDYNTGNIRVTWTHESVENKKEL